MGVLVKCLLRLLWDVKILKVSYVTNGHFHYSHTSIILNQNEAKEGINWEKAIYCLKTSGPLLFAGLPTQLPKGTPPIMPSSNQLQKVITFE